MNFDQYKNAFVSSDWHFGHANIIKYSPKSRGHFKDIEEMNEAIIRNVNAKVKKDDIIFILGDVGFCKPEKTMMYLARINCDKYIVFGNHDSKLRESGVFNDIHARNMAKVIGFSSDLVISRKVGDKKMNVVMYHFPIESWDRMHHGSIHLFGHRHTDKADHKNINRSRDVGMDGNDMMPYNMDDLLIELEKNPIKFEGHHDGSRQ